MKKFVSVLFVVILFTAFSSALWAAPRYDRYSAPPEHAVYGQPYFLGHVGLFEPNNSRDGLSGYDRGANFDVGIGSRVSPILAIEGMVGAFAADNGPDEVTVVPLTFGLRLIVPNPIIEPYIGGGVGFYFANLKEEAAPGFSGIDDSDTTVGGYGSIGLDAWLNPRIAFNIEGKYHWAEPSFESNAGNQFDVKVGGWTVNLGVRISF